MGTLYHFKWSGATETLHIPAGETCRVLGKVEKAKIEKTSAPVRKMLSY